MKKLAKKLSVFALSSVMLLSNSPIKAGIFAEGQTYNLEQFGRATITDHFQNDDDSIETFEVQLSDLPFSIDVYRANYEIAYVIRDNANSIVASDTLEGSKCFLTAQFVLTILIKRITEIAAHVQVTPQNQHARKTSPSPTKHVNEKKPKKSPSRTLRQITYALPNGIKNNYANGPCVCEKPKIRHSSCAVYPDRPAVPKPLPRLTFYVCDLCRKPVPQYRAAPKDCCWTAYCPFCGNNGKFFMVKNKKNTCVLRCCAAWPFEIHELEYACYEDFNKAADRGEIKHICSKNPDHHRAHAYKRRTGAHCMDCMHIYTTEQSKN